jgi:hypothetical protein
MREEAVTLARVRKSSSIDSGISARPSLTPEAKEKKLIAMAYDLVEQRLRDGTASSQETTHFLKLGTERARLENRLLAAQTEMAVAKKEQLQSMKRTEELFEEAMVAFRQYSGQDDESDGR